MQKKVTHFLCLACLCQAPCDAPCTPTREKPRFLTIPQWLGVSRTKQQHPRYLEPGPSSSNQCITFNGNGNLKDGHHFLQDIQSYSMQR